MPHVSEVRQHGSAGRRTGNGPIPVLLGRRLWMPAGTTVSGTPGVVPAGPRLSPQADPLAVPASRFEQGRCRAPFGVRSAGTSPAALARFPPLVLRGWRGHIAFMASTNVTLMTGADRAWAADLMEHRSEAQVSYSPVFRRTAESAIPPAPEDSGATARTG
jgi:hypothetical protein